MTTPSLEIFVPTFNRIDYLRECLLSIMNQTFRDFKIIVLDNASDQDVSGLIRELADSRIQLIINSKNIGGAKNIQKAFDLASAELVVIFHDDDCMHPKLIESEMLVMCENPQLSFLTTSVNVVYNPSMMLKFSRKNNLKVEYLNTPDDLIDGFLSSRGFGFGSVMYRTHIAKQFRLEIERFSQVADRPYLVSLATVGPCARLINPNYNVRCHCGQDSQSNSWSYLHEMEVAKYYLEISHLKKLKPLQDKLVKMLVQLYVVRHPRANIITWLRALHRMNLLYWIPMVKYLLFYVPRHIVARIIKLLAPSMYQRNVQKRLMKNENI